eukprot:COSAG02_NODE_2257_length_9341_cov_13.355118_8_plen_109_part_00
MAESETVGGASSAGMFVQQSLRRRSGSRLVLRTCDVDWNRHISCRRASDLVHLHTYNRHNLAREPIDDLLRQVIGAGRPPYHPIRAVDRAVVGIEPEDLSNPTDQGAV